MFRPYELPTPKTPARTDHAMSAPHADMLAAPAPVVHAPLPSNWDQLDPDQRVRSIGEW